MIDQEQLLFPEVERMPLFWANLLAKEKIVVNQGGTSSGKSQSLVRLAFLHCINPDLLPLLPDAKGKGIKAEITASTFPKLQGDTLEIAEGLYMNNTVLRLFVKSYNQTKHTFYFHNGSKLVFRAYEKPKDAEGPKRDVLYINEARNLPWTTANYLIQRTMYKVYLDYNPTHEFWVHEKIINCQPGPNGLKQFPSVKVIRSWHEHNLFLSKEKHDEIESISDPELWKAYARGLTAKISGLVFPNWVEVPNEAIQGISHFYWGIDYGYTNDPTCLVRVFDNVVYGGVKYDHVFDEIFYATGAQSAFIYQQMMNNGYRRGQRLWSEHDKTIIRELRQLGIHTYPAYKGQGSVESGVLHLRAKKCAYTSRSVNIKEESKKYSFLENPDGTSSNKPEDKNNHSMDASRYAAVTEALRNGKAPDVRREGYVEQYVKE